MKTLVSAATAVVLAAGSIALAGTKPAQTHPAPTTAAAPAPTAAKGKNVKVMAKKPATARHHKKVEPTATGTSHQ